ncbi:MAG: ATP-dependent helicase [Flavobacteriales bacterium]|nr:ATP-dependent helicase [Flavobacteriales bacterium]
MNVPNEDQNGVLEDNARIRVVSAVPGSGKTWLVAELIRRELINWTSSEGGIAALSFTNVGGDEIRRAVGHDLDHPHFVGTLDAFLFRHVIRPFLPKVRPAWRPPRLIAADWEPFRWRKGPQNIELETGISSGPGRKIHLLDVAFVSENGGLPVLAYKPHRDAPLSILSAEHTSTVLSAKKNLWEKTGWITHSDAAYLASWILGSAVAKNAILAEVTRRYPLIVVDELQDTGFFLGKCVLDLLTTPAVRGVLVGDPDQAIYEFNGARPDLFQKFFELDGATALSLRTTKRFGSTISLAAQQLNSGTHISPESEKTGQCFLVTYTDMPSDVRALAAALAKHPNANRIRIIARQKSVVNTIAELKAKALPSLGSPGLAHVHYAVNSFNSGNANRALAQVRAAYERIVFGREGVEDELLSETGLDPIAWKEMCARSLQFARIEIPGETLGAWGDRMIAHMKESLLAAKDDLPMSTIRKVFTREANKERGPYLVHQSVGGADEMRVAVSTIHSVKGETHGMTVIICPHPSTEADCPSRLWWPAAGDIEEERRIAYVALTRSSGDVVLCISPNTMENLRRLRPEFVEQCRSMTIAEYIASLAAT